MHFAPCPTDADAGRAPRRSRRALWTGLALLLLVGVVSCGDGSTGPVAESEALTLRVEAGDAQAGLPGLPLPDRIAIRVTGPDGLPREGSRLEADILSGAGTTSARRFSTNAEGRAFVEWELGPEVGEQGLAVTSLDSSDPMTVTVSATALGPDETDVVVVRGAGGPLLGAVLFDPGGIGSVGRIVQERVAVGPDTVLTLLPVAGPETEIIVFGQGNLPGRARATWSPGVDTVVVSLLPPVAVDLVINSYVDSLGPAVPLLLEQADIMEEIWAREGMGLTLGEVTVNQLWQDGVERNAQSSSLCPGAAAQRGQVLVNVVHAIDEGAFNGWGCTSGNVWMGGSFERFPNLLAHELGHVFALPHTALGVMVPSPPGRTFTEGEVFSAHFSAWSGLNTVLEIRPVDERVDCRAGRPDSPCLPADYDLGDGARGR